MSLDFYLEAVRPVEIFRDNATHNLTEMADKAGIYSVLWRPEENGFKLAGEIIPALRNGLADLESRPAYFKKFNPENGWGTYDGFVKFVRRVLEACEENPDATIRSCV